MLIFIFNRRFSDYNITASLITYLFAIITSFISFLALSPSLAIYFRLYILRVLGAVLVKGTEYIIFSFIRFRFSAFSYSAYFIFIPCYIYQLEYFFLQISLSLLLSNTPHFLSLYRPNYTVIMSKNIKYSLIGVNSAFVLENDGLN